MRAFAIAARTWYARLGGSYALLLAGSFLLCLTVAGWDAVIASLRQDLRLIVYLVPIIGCAVVIGGIVRVLLPSQVVGRWLGAESGWRGILLATLVGATMPGGPMVAFPLAIAFHRAGADAGAMIAFLTSWSVLGIQRIIVWDVPLLGPEIAGLRYLVSIPLPVIAGLLARQLVSFVGEPGTPPPPGRSLPR
jgi:uncharacterized membrane protein YraQ (UPF0718 family)